MLRGGRLEVLAVFDKPDPLEGPYFEETLYVTPSRLPTAVLAEVEAVTARAARALGLREGPIHAELRVDGERVSVLELAARSIGGLCSRALRFGAGVSLEQVILRHALGLGLEDLARESAAAGVMMIPIPAAGVLRAVEGQEEARAVEGIGGLEITIARGRPVVPLPDGDRYLGFLFARAASADAVERSLRAAHGLPADPDRAARARAGRRALAWVTRARPPGLVLRAGPPALGPGLAPGIPSARGARRHGLDLAVEPLDPDAVRQAAARGHLGADAHGPAPRRRSGARRVRRAQSRGDPSASTGSTPT